jgi:hypothetical protein
MSRDLPPHPDIEHLRKQAKHLLRDLQQRDPAVKLSEAQHALAREYGFASWPRLVAHVEAAPTRTPRSPFAGLWIANVEKSRRHPANEFLSATVQFDVAGDTVTMTNVFVDSSGREHRGTNTIRADGQERAAETGGGYVLRASWRGPNVLETEARKDGQPAGWGKYEVSADGSSLTIASDDQLIVLERAARTSALA